MKLEYFVKPLSFTLPDYTFTAERLPVQASSHGETPHQA